MGGTELADSCGMATESALRRSANSRAEIPSVIALALVIAAGSASVLAISARAASWWLGVCGAVTLGTMIALMVWGGLVRPLQREIAAERRARRLAEGELAERRTLDRLLNQTDIALSLAVTEADALDTLGRGIHALADDRQAAVLLAGAEDDRTLRWRLDASAAGLGRPHALAHAGPCVALATGRSAGHASSRDLDTCAHAASDRDEVSTLCVPVPLHDGFAGVINLVGGPGDEPSDAELAAIERLARTAGDRIDTLRSAAQKVESITDPMTGLPNHTSFRRELKQCIGALTPFSLALCDFDGFAAFNEEHGREAGDRVLRGFASALSETLRPGDVCARYDSDVFAVIFPRCSTMHAQAALERVRESLVLRAADAETAPIAWSAGISDSNQGSSVDELLETADIALMVAKHEGGNRVRTATFTEAATDVTD
jgi:diguanylate cyclase (GGDEF)-like protein